MKNFKYFLLGSLILFGLKLNSLVAQQSQTEILLCCDDPDAIRAFFEARNYDSYFCTILDGPAIRDTVSGQKRVLNAITDYANGMSIQLDEVSATVAFFLQKEIDAATTFDHEAKGFITHNPNFCDGTIFQAIGGLNDINNAFASHYHVWKNPDNSGKDLLFVDSYLKKLVNDEKYTCFLNTQVESEVKSLIAADQFKVWGNGDSRLILNTSITNHRFNTISGVISDPGEIGTFVSNSKEYRAYYHRTNNAYWGYAQYGCMNENTGIKRLLCLQANDFPSITRAEVPTEVTPLLYFFEDENNGCKIFKENKATTPMLVSQSCCDKSFKKWVEGEENNIKEALSFYQFLIDYVKDVSGCTDFRPYQDPGIVPACFWINEDRLFPPFIYAPLSDRSYSSGIVDGTFGVLSGVVSLGKGIFSVPKYLAGLIACARYEIKTPEQLEAYKAELELADIDETVKGKMREALIYLQLNYTEFKNDYCTENAETTKKIQSIVKSLPSLIKIKEKIFAAIDQAIDDVSGFENTNRYYQGRFGVEILSSFIPASAISKLGKGGVIVANVITDIEKVIAQFGGAAKRIMQKLAIKHISPPRLNELVGANFKAFIKDLAENAGLIDLIEELGEGAIKAWETAFTRNLPASWRTNPRFLEVFKKVIDDVYLDDHIRKGHSVTRSDGSISGIQGVHHKDAITVTPGQTAFTQGDVRIKPNTKNPSNAGPDDLYVAEPEIFGLNKSTNPPTQEWLKKNGGGGKSTFYPDSWSKEKIQNEISFAREKITASDFDTANGWFSTWNSEGTFKIAMYVDDIEDLSSGIGSAFPLLP